MKNLRNVILLLAMSLVMPWGQSGCLWAQTTPIGSEFQVNATVTGSQRNPKLAFDGQGNAVVMWENSGVSLGRQMFGNGALGPELFLAADRVAGIGRAVNGEIVVAFNVSGGVSGQVFDGLGNPQGGPFVVTDDPFSRATSIEIATADGGEFVVVWATTPAETGTLILARQMNLDGVPQGEALLVNNYTAGSQSDPDVSMAANGDFVVTWISTSSPGDDNDISSIQGRAFASNGQPMSDQFQVNTVTTLRQDVPAVTWLADGSTAFTWQDNNNLDIAMQRADASGQLLGPWTLVNTLTADFQGSPDIVDLDDGGFLIVWESDGSPGSDHLSKSIQARRFDSQGLPVADQFQVNSYLPQAQSRPMVATGGHDQVLVVWQSNGSAGDDSDGFSIQGQRFGPLLPEVFVDGFESGSTAAWTAVTP